MSRVVKVATVDEVPPRTMRAVEVDGRRVLLINLDGEIRALDACCPHRGGPLEQGELWQGALECPWHHYRYDVRTGENLYPRNVYPPEVAAALRRQLQPVRRYALRIADGHILVEV
jgi:nitrite reductase/ring-hydroxylating ferredoxin subunit